MFAVKVLRLDPRARRDTEEFRQTQVGHYRKGRDDHAGRVKEAEPPLFPEFVNQMVGHAVQDDEQLAGLGVIELI